MRNVCTVGGMAAGLVRFGLWPIETGDTTGRELVPVVSGMGQRRHELCYL